MEYAMTLAMNNPDRLFSPKEVIEYLRTRYGIHISLASFYTMISRGEAPKVTYFRGRPKFTIADIDEWVRNNLSPKRK
jgi:predicted DNA-binding transcriptional regulator AlpA